MPKSESEVQTAHATKRVGKDLPPAPSNTEAPDSQLTKASVKIKLKTSTGMTLDYDLTSGTATPNKTVVSAIWELARIAAVAGCATEALNAVDEACNAVADWRSEESRVSAKSRSGNK